MAVDDDYPLNCIERVYDGFSGWFAITNPRKCNDFCYWDIVETNHSQGSRYTALNTADPHQTTVIYDDADNFTRAVAHWVCMYDSADDETLASHASGDKWIYTWNHYVDKSTINSFNNDNTMDNVNVPFPFLRCHKGAGENLRTYAGDAVQSPFFWQSWIMLCSSVIFIQAVMLCTKKRIRYDRLNIFTAESVVMDDLQLNESRETDRYDRLSIEIEESTNPTEEDNSTQQRELPPHNDDRRCKYCTPYLSHKAFRLLRVLSIVALNILLVTTIAFSSLSLMETKYHVELSDAMEKFTPECTNPYTVCKRGNEEIDKVPAFKSTDERGKGLSKSSESSTSIEPFSYIIASDAQLYWFNGEFAEMGDKSIPSSCTENDSCGHCTAKHGYNTNLRMKKAWEILMTGSNSSQAGNSSIELPTPSTLVMNGDLTAYFHPYQKHAYESIYSDINGLKHFFPGLGNHDIEHIGGAMYGGDEWFGPANCNVEHAIGYLKSGFCDKIPFFSPERIVRYDPSSLAYSWEEGRYHFVMLHYYPTYELASMNFRSSVKWLDRDLQLAHDSGQSIILFVHSAEGLNPAMENVILGKGVKAIFAGHTHRCLHRRCDGIYPLNKDQVNNLDSLNLTVDNCMPAGYDLCPALE